MLGTTHMRELSKGLHTLVTHPFIGRWIQSSQDSQFRVVRLHHRQTHRTLLWAVIRKANLLMGKSFTPPAATLYTVRCAAGAGC